MPRTAHQLWLRPEPAAIEAYVVGHANVYPELLTLIRASGIRRYTIWLDGTDLLLTRRIAATTPRIAALGLRLRSPVRAAGTPRRCGH